MIYFQLGSVDLERVTASLATSRRTAPPTFAWIVDLVQSTEGVGFSDLLARLLGPATTVEEAVSALWEQASVRSAPSAEKEWGEVEERVNLALEVGNLGIRRGQAGRLEEAIVAFQQAVDIYRELTKEHPEVFLPDLAKSLSNLSTPFSELRRFGEALGIAREAVALYRELSVKDRRRHRPDIASACHNLGACLADLGRHDEAVAAF